MKLNEMESQVEVGNGRKPFSRRKFLEMMGISVASLAMTACGGGSSGEQTPEEQVQEVLENSNAILEPIQVLARSYNYIDIYSAGVDEDGIEHVDFYAICNGRVVCKVSKEMNGSIEFNEQIRLSNLEDDTVYELRTVCYSIDGKTKSIEKNSVKTFAKTPNDPSNDEPDEPEVNDDTAPVITLNGPSTITLTVGDTYTDPGFTANDNVDGDLTSEVIIEGTVDPSTVGTYTVTYTVYDEAGNKATAIRTVKVEEALNHAPEANDITVDANRANNYTVDVSSLINDADGDNLTVSIESYSNASGDLEYEEVSVSGTNVYVKVNGGTGDAKIIYKVDDGKGGTNTGEIIVQDLDGE